MIIQSLLDTDLYKFTMMQVVLHHFPQAQVEYRFKCRNANVDLTPYIDEIRVEVAHLCSLRFTEGELAYLRGMRFIKSDFVDFLALFHLNEKYVSIEPAPQGNGEIEIAIRGPWLHTILFEVPLLAIVNEVYFRRTQPRPDLPRAGAGWNRSSLAASAEVPRLRDRGLRTRRRFSRDWQEEVLLSARKMLGLQLAGTSNVLFARLHNMVPLGTMAHEYLQACQALGPRLRDSQVFALENWAREYRGDLGIALSDTYGFDAFLRDFDLYFCKLFDGACPKARSISSPATAMRPAPRWRATPASTTSRSPVRRRPASWWRSSPPRTTCRSRSNWAASHPRSSLPMPTWMR